MLDMNSTFMFGEDRFSTEEDFSSYYRSIGGHKLADDINQIIRSLYQYLEQRYSDANYRDNFPSVVDALNHILPEPIPKDEVDKIVSTFSYHELGYIPVEYISALHELRDQFILSAVIDIWSPKTLWLETFRDTGILDFFSVISFSSDIGSVKPSEKPFKAIVKALSLDNSEILVVGDSPERDLTGASNAGLDCVLVGGKTDNRAIREYKNLIQFSKNIINGGI